MAKYAALVSSASEGAVTTGRRMASALDRAALPENTAGPAATSTTAG